MRQSARESFTLVSLTLVDGELKMRTDTFLAGRRQGIPPGGWKRETRYNSHVFVRVFSNLPYTKAPDEAYHLWESESEEKLNVPIVKSTKGKLRAYLISHGPVPSLESAYLSLREALIGSRETSIRECDERIRRIQEERNKYLHQYDALRGTRFDELTVKGGIITHKKETN